MVDSFLSRWTNFKFYAFPPFSMVMKTVTKIETDVATGVLVCPMWPTQAWYPRVMRLLIDVPLILPQNILSLPFKHEATCKHKKLRLMACLLSGDISLTEAFRATLLPSCAPPGEKLLVNNTQCALRNGFISAIEGNFIPYRSMK